jgi:hypothetical protein
MKDRSGPGIMTVSTGREDVGEAAPSAGDEVAAWIALEHAHRQKRAARKMANERRKNFIIGHL